MPGCRPAGTASAGNDTIEDRIAKNAAMAPKRINPSCCILLFYSRRSGGQSNRDHAWVKASVMACHTSLRARSRSRRTAAARPLNALARIPNVDARRVAALVAGEYVHHRAPHRLARKILVEGQHARPVTGELRAQAR